MTTSSAITASAAPPTCVYADEPAPARAYSQWAVTVLDTRFALPPEYVPPDLVAVAPALPSGATAGGSLLVREHVLTDLGELLAAAQAAGVPLAIQSAYRSYAYQADTFAYWVSVQGEERALLTSARPGHSEHQLGTVVDFRSEDGPPAWDLDDWGNEPAGAWLAANGWRHGFVMSYPRGAQSESCYTYEPWHYRYVGRELAAHIHESGLVPRVALWHAAQEVDTDD